MLNMNLTFKIRSIALLAMIWTFCIGLSAQSVSFTVAGTNPHCMS